MRWKRGDKCIFNEDVVRRIIKPICEESLHNNRIPSCYSVVAVSEDQTMVVIVGKERHIMGVMTEWILPYEEPAWTEIKHALNQSKTPTALIWRLRNVGGQHEL